MVGDVLGDFGQHLAEHGLVECRPSIARQVAMREVAKLAMLCCVFTFLVAFAEQNWSSNRMSKYNSKTGPSKKKLSLKRWHGPGLLGALEGHGNCFIFPTRDSW